MAAIRRIGVADCPAFVVGDDFPAFVVSDD
jgi:hypothetical protein